eukprot:1952308-Pyramimonas_sp.AAC.1
MTLLELWGQHQVGSSGKIIFPSVAGRASPATQTNQSTTCDGPSSSSRDASPSWNTRVLSAASSERCHQNWLHQPWKRPGQAHWLQSQFQAGLDVERSQP